VTPAVNAKAIKSEEKIAEIKQSLSALEHLSSGTLLKRMKVCGNPRCHCASDPAARHGPYYEWSYLKGGKLRHRTLTPEQADIMRLAIANYRKAKKLLRAWEAQTLNLIELKGRLESRPREFHPKPLAEPYVTLSRHTAPIVRTVIFPRASQ
jgi:uncharacterized protein DUF6788